LLGIDIDTELELDNKIDIYRSTASFDKYLEIALLNNPEVRNAMFQKYSAEINFKSVEFSKLPQLWAEASYKTVLSDNYSGVGPTEDKSFF
jgi:outer membrane protein TolC